MKSLVEMAVAERFDDCAATKWRWRQTDSQPASQPGQNDEWLWVGEYRKRTNGEVKWRKILISLLRNSIALPAEFVVSGEFGGSAT